MSKHYDYAAPVAQLEFKSTTQNIFLLLKIKQTLPQQQIADANFKRGLYLLQTYLLFMIKAMAGTCAFLTKKLQRVAVNIAHMMESAKILDRNWGQCT